MTEQYKQSRKLEQILQVAENITCCGSRAFVSPDLIKSVDEVINARYSVANWKKDDRVIERLARAYDGIRGRYSPEHYIGDVPYLWAAYYVAQNTYKAQYVLSKILRSMDEIPDEFNIIDVGTGVGSTVWAVVDYLRILENLCHIYGQKPFFKHVEIIGLEASQESLSVYEEIRSRYFSESSMPQRLSVRTIQPVLAGGDNWLDCVPSEKTSIVFFSNMLSELSSTSEAEQIVNDCWQHVAPNSVLALIEPADRRRSTALHELQSRLSQRHQLHTWGPCGRIGDAGLSSQKCMGCWTFGQQHLNGSEGMKIIEQKLYELFPRKYLDANRSDEFYNYRVKWSWSIMSSRAPYGVSSNRPEYLDKHPDRCTTLHLAVNGGEPKFIIAEVVGLIHKQGSRKITYKLCDQSGGVVTIDVPGGEDPGIIAGTFAVLAKYGVENGHLQYRKDTVFRRLNPEKIPTIRATPHDSLALRDACKFFLKRFWGFEDFRSRQFDIIRRALMRKSVIGILPTGTGKSLCFQLPAFLSPGTAIVVSPLKSLMDDQLENLKARGFDHGGYIDIIHGRMSKRERDVVLNRFAAGQLKILYVAPERFRMESFFQQLQKMRRSQPVSYLVIDEAHCISEWGHDFRASYLMLRLKCRQIGDPPIIALTATASRMIREDICRLLEIEENEENVVRSETLSRPEISMSVWTAKKLEDKEKILRAYFGDESSTDSDPVHLTLGYNSYRDMTHANAGVVFVPYGKKNINKHGELTSNAVCSAEYVSEMLTKHGFENRYYHSKLPDPIQAKVQAAFRHNEFSLLIATKGFGMGIDKPNIDFIVHYAATGSLESLYQEGGRAGRDGMHAHHAITSTPPYSEDCSIERAEHEGRPKCVRENTWQKCPYTGQSYEEQSLRCDYGRMADFIEVNLPSSDEIRGYFEKVYSKVSETANDLSCEISAPQSMYINGHVIDFANWVEQVLYYYSHPDWDQAGDTSLSAIVRDFTVVDYSGWGKDMQVHFRVDLNPGWRDVPMKRYVDKCVSRYAEIKRRRYWMLEMVDRYVSSSSQYYRELGIENPPSACRRNMLMAYFQEEALDLSRPCEFCDLCCEHIPRGQDKQAVVEIASEGQRLMFKLYRNAIQDGLFCTPVTQLIELLRVAWEEDLILSALQPRILGDLVEDQKNPFLLLIRSCCSLLLENHVIAGEWEEAFTTIAGHEECAYWSFENMVVELSGFFSGEVAEQLQNLWTEVFLRHVSAAVDLSNSRTQSIDLLLKRATSKQEQPS